MARPSRYTINTADKIIQAIELGASRDAAAAVVGITDTTLYEWMNKHSEFADRVHKADAVARQKVEQLFFSDVLKDKGDWRARIAWLQAKYPGDWSAKSKLEVTGKDEGPIEIRMLADAIVQAAADAAEE